MNINKILENIIRDGNCGWILRQKEYCWTDICKKCPLSKLKKNKDGRYLPCIEAVCGDTIYMPQSDIYEKYRKIATELLTDILINEILRV